ncbi:MAG TPA: hypothetical protein VFK04_05905 [Gemmatimonadaceae bacterium]|nr:hypothetical protein [Gemmatimonadaceae bacterium]
MEPDAAGSAGGGGAEGGGGSEEGNFGWRIGRGVKLAETRGLIRYVETPEGHTAFGKALAPALVAPVGAVGPETAVADLRAERYPAREGGQSCTRSTRAGSSGSALARS